MNQIRLYMDEDSGDTALVLPLKNRGVDIITTLGVNRLSFPDEEQLIWATLQNRVVYTSNIRDFYRLHTTFLSQGKSHAGMILVKQQYYSVGELMRGILRLVTVKSAEEMVNQVEFLGAWIDK
ncbi:DUF5615 family PIN-like protein [Cronbergia sp. UHCC 0137]|uniref:DUF5615 family PIN-like protein n=1 Tax=Cronbergia sp. UHCC 0137 TaxID=3110239 RepID=UPI002B1E929C|nr:DUF5615 family PIN-like protein [Cronbergia sp. UHCC 0137]MEA5621263.1 DUF5615 family PIN-like protein [Cronbergia sp. UHCC 0137]